MTGHGAKTEGLDAQLINLNYYGLAGALERRLLYPTVVLTLQHYCYLTEDACFECKCYVPFIVQGQNTSIFRRKSVIQTLQQYKLSGVHKTHNISCQVLWNWLMLVLNHKRMLSLLSSSNEKAVLAKLCLMGLQIRTEQQGTAKCYLKSACLTLKLNPKSTLPMVRKKGRARCLSLGT